MIFTKITLSAIAFFSILLLLKGLPLFDSENYTDVSIELLETKKFRIFSYNIRRQTDHLSDGELPWTQRKEGVIMNIESNSNTLPILVGLQEVLKDNLEQIMDKLGTDWDYYGVGRADGKEKGEFNPILYQKLEWALKYSNTYWLSSTPSTVSLDWNANHRRIVTVCTFHHKKENYSVNFLNTQFDDGDLKAKENSAILIIKLIDQISRNGNPTIISGDFNCEETDDAYKVLKSSLQDASIKAVNKGKTNPGFSQDPKNGKTIDYIFMKRDSKWTIIEEQLLYNANDDLIISDHLPLFADFQWQILS